MTNHHTIYYRRQEAAKYIQNKYGFTCSQAWLASLASKGGGPIFQKAGRVPLYCQADLDAWAKSRLSKPYRASGVLADESEA